MERFVLFVVFSIFLNTNAVLMKQTRKLPFNAKEMFGDDNQFVTGTNSIVGVEVLDFESVPEPPPSPKVRSAELNEPDVNLIREHFHNGMASVRNKVTNATQAWQTMGYLSQVLAQILGKDNVILQPFKVEIGSYPNFEKLNSSLDPELFSKATNIIGILKGPTYGQANDTAFVITAHWDSVPNSPGVDDDGSGTVAVLELVRLLQARKKPLPFTVYFGLFDLEEYGLIGSYVFEASYLSPKIESGSVNVIGVFNLDMIISYNSSNNTQVSEQSLNNSNPEIVEEIKQRGSKGDFVAVLARAEHDKRLTSVISEAFHSLEQNKTKMYIFTAKLPKTYGELTDDHIKKFKLFTRSDHYNFWYPMRENTTGGGWKPNDEYHNFTMSAVMFIDTAFMREYQMRCYHKPCDDDTQLTATNLEFISTIIQTADRSIDLLAKQITCDEDDEDDEENSASVRGLQSKEMLLFSLILLVSHFFVLY